MKEHPILFTGSMARAILEGRKTQTRRPIKPQPPASWQPTVGTFHPTKVNRKGIEFPGEAVFGASDEAFGCRAPFAVGDRLWVRETWCQQADSLTERLIAGKAHYAADGYEVHNVDGLERSPWRPSIHMPRWASRLTLEVTDIRPERVKAITEADAIAEGAAVGDRPLGEFEDDYRQAGFAAHWDSIYDSGPFAWNANPWVWATTFKVVKP